MGDGDDQGGRSDLARRRRKRLVAVTVVASLVAALVGVVALWGVPALRARQPLPARTPGSWVFALALDPPPGWSIVSHGVVPFLESLTLQNVLHECRVTAILPTAPPAYRRPPPEVTEPVRVNGRPASYSTAYPSSVAWPTDNADGDAGVRMAYGDGGTLDVVCNPVHAEVLGIDTRTLVLDLAGRLRFSTGEPLLLPFTLERIPPGFEIVSVQHQNSGSDVLFTSGGDLTFAEQAVAVTVRPTRPELEWRPTVVDGQRAGLSLGSGRALLCRPLGRQFGCVHLTDEAIPLENPDAPAARRGVALVTEIMRSVRFAPDLEDRSTWVAAEDALPS